MTPEILLIDDDVYATSIRKRVLEYRGYRVQIALDGAAGIQLAAALEPALVLFDHQLPGMCGPELIQELRAVLPNTPLVSLSGHANIDYLYDGLQPTAYIVKGDPVHAMLKTVADLIG